MRSFLTVLCVACSLQAAGNNWLSNISDNTYLSKLSIPGTHDSGARYEPWSGTAKCQDLTISEQLSAGVRYLDIRCRRINDSFEIHHGAIYQNINFDYVLNSCSDFLTANPTETIIMSVKEEYDAENCTLSFEQIFKNYVAKKPALWHQESSIAKLGEVRGKIVLFRRFPASSTGGLNASNWPDNTTFSITGSANMRVQDFYNCSTGDAKWNAINSMFTETISGNESTLYLNYTSGYKSGLFGLPNITGISNDINPRLESYFSTNKSGRFGVIVMDFANAYRCEKIYSTNPHTNLTVNLNTSEYNYDFGTPYSPVMSGWLSISEDTSGDIYWSDEIQSRDRGEISGINDINRDMVRSGLPATLEHKIQNGRWLVTINLGDALNPHGNMGVSAEKILQASEINSAAGEFPYVIFKVAVVDGSLSIRFDDGGGSTNWAVTRLSIQRSDHDSDNNGFIDLIDFAKLSLDWLESVYQNDILLFMEKWLIQ